MWLWVFTESLILYLFCLFSSCNSFIFYFLFFNCFKKEPANSFAMIVHHSGLCEFLEFLQDLCKLCFLSFKQNQKEIAQPSGLIAYYYLLPNCYEMNSYCLIQMVKAFSLELDPKVLDTVLYPYLQSPSLNFSSRALWAIFLKAQFAILPNTRHSNEQNPIRELKFRRKSNTDLLSMEITFSLPHRCIIWCDKWYVHFTSSNEFV